jgi:predicted NAD-dependent protein-ADP-ribosyltransferase YbiA (DUF1768 family)
MRTIGCELLTAEELKEIGMVNSTATFDVSWEMAKKKGEKFPMSPAIKEFSFLNRWFIFKRKRQESVAAAAMAEAEVSGIHPAIAPRLVPGAAVPRGRSANVANTARANSLAPTAIQEADAVNVRNKRTSQVAQAVAAVPQPPEGTVAVAPGAAAPAERSYTKGEVFLFYGKAAVNDDQLKIKDPGAGRWLSPSARFAIEDPETKILYPTVEHYIAGMRMKLATNKPELAETIFSRDGSIHQKFLADRVSLTNAGTKPLSEEEDARQLELEIAAVKDAMREPFLKRYWRGTPGKIVDEAAWASVKGDVIEDAINQRWKKDARFRTIVNKARDLGKYLLYYTPGALSSNVGGIRSTKTGVIEGQNLIGKTIMRLAGYPQ